MTQRAQTHGHEAFVQAEVEPPSSISLPIIRRSPVDTNMEDFLFDVCETGIVQCLDRAVLI